MGVRRWCGAGIGMVWGRVSRSGMGMGYQGDIRRFIERLPGQTDTGRILDELHGLLVGALGVGSYQLVTLGGAARGFQVQRSHPGPAGRRLPELGYDCPLFRYFRETRAVYLAYTAAGGGGGAELIELAAEARRQLTDLEPEYGFGLMAGDEPLGLLLVGARLEGAGYTAEAVEGLAELAGNLRLVASLCRLENELESLRELDVLGRMSRGMAHDLNNLMTPIATFVQLKDLGEIPRDVREDLLPVSLRNLETIRRYIRETLTVAEQRQAVMGPCRLDRVVAEAVAGQEALVRGRGVRVELGVSVGVVVRGDESLLQRLLANLLANATDACEAGGEVRVELTPRQGPGGQPWVRLRVVDTGAGMSPETLRRIDTPYFTTKSQGATVGGYGLGLAISRKIVHLHGGAFGVRSGKGCGTTVEVDFPSEQNQDLPKE